VTRYLEDITVGDKIAFGPYEVTEREIIEFATKYDPQRIHTDSAFAAKSDMGGLIASGWHTSAIFMKMMVDSIMDESSGMVSPGIDELRWLRPVRPGDILRAEGEVIGARPSQSKPDRGIVKTRYKVLNQDNDVVMGLTTNNFMRRRDAAADKGKTMGEDITLKAEDGFELDAYLALPSGTPKGAVVVIQEIFGVNGHIREDADTFAKAGYATIAPGMFDRMQKGVDLAYDADGVEAGREFAMKADWDNVVKDVRAASAAVKQYGKVGLVGYCWGGTVAWVSAVRDCGVDCASGYYGGKVIDFVDEAPKVPVMLHFGDKDHGIPVETVEKIKAAHPEVPVYRYAEAEHGFHCDQRPSYHAESDKLSTERTMAFFKEHIG
jgi:carboxymethylenebutenolidase